MKLYKIEAQLHKNSHCSLIPNSNTIFGAICWSIFELYGKELLEEILDNYDNHDKTFRVSSMFPYGYLPLNSTFLNKEISQLFESVDQLKENQSNYISSIKKVKKYEWIEENKWQQLSEEKIDKLTYIRELLENNEEYPSFYKTQVRTRNMVNRLSGSVEKGQNLFYIKSIVPETNNKFQFFLMTKDIDFYSIILKYLSDGNIGGNKSVGMNRFILKVEKEMEVKEKELYLNLSRYIPNEEEINFSESFYNINSSADQTESIFYQFGIDGIKSPINFISEGSVIKLNKNIEKEKLGQLPIVLIDNEQSIKIRTNGKPILI